MPGLTDRIFELVTKHLEGTIAAEEQRELNQWVNESPVNREAVEEFLKEETLLNGITNMYQWRARVWDNLQNKIDSEKVVPMHRKLWWKYGAAAAIILVTGYVLWVTGERRSQDTSNKTQVAKTHDVPAPKDTRAVITLADGRKLYLDSAGNGTIAQENNVNVVKNSNGEILYLSPAGGGELSASPNNKRPGVDYNTLYNPRGSKVVSLTLNDGTKVWLNSESSLKYPAAFIDNERTVEITGEAYFEVAHNASKPFHVKKGNTDVTVLGTHFNVNAYDDEDALKVTLLEGSVKLSSAGGGDLDKSSNNKRPGVDNGVIIKPGQQAVVSNPANPLIQRILVQTNVDLEQVMAWKNGLFKFDKTDIQTVMRQISRWYDVEVSYPNGIPKDEYWGGIRRDQNLSTVFKVLEASGAHFKIEGKKVIVMK